MKTTSRRKRERPAPRHLACSAPRPGTCPRCGGKILSALVHGEKVRMDAARLSRKGEAVALISGWSTYQWGDSRDEHVRHRNTGMILSELPATAWIHADHRCGLVWAGEYLDTRVIHVPPTGIHPPF
jgi:hypothetical protein